MTDKIANGELDEAVRRRLLLRNSNVAAKIGSIFYIWNYDSQDGNSTAKLLFAIAESSKKVYPGDCDLTTDNRKWQYDRQKQKYLCLWNYDR